MSKKSSNSRENSTKTKIDEKFIDKIYKELISSEIFNIEDVDFKIVDNKPLIYLFHCNLLKSHDYLKFGKGEKSSTRIRVHLSGRSGILNSKISRDINLQSKAGFKIKQVKNPKYNERRKNLIKKHCKLQYVILEDKFDLYDSIYQCNNCHENWYDYWKKIYPEMDRAREKDYDELEVKNPTHIIEKPIEQRVWGNLRYKGNQPAKKTKKFDWENYNL